MRGSARAQPPRVVPLVAVAALAAAGAGMPFPEAEATLGDAPRPTQAAQEPLADFRAIRAAEGASDRGRIEEILRLADGSRASDPTGVVALRARDALDAVARRRAAATAAELADAEDAIESARGALLARLRGEDFASARALEAETVLESAEDLLLRRLSADATDAMLAVGIPTEAELDAASRIQRAARARLADPALAGPLDEAALFRSRVLDGLSALLEHDIARVSRRAGDAGAARARARAALDGADAGTLVVPPALAEILALARARADDDPARRAGQLAIAAESADPATRLVARVERWRDAGCLGEAPRAGSGADILSQLSLAAEVRALSEAGSDTAAIAAAIERWIDRAGRGGVERAALRTAPLLADRAIDETSPPVLTAISLLARPVRGAALARGAVLAAARDARVGPSLALRAAEVLLLEGDAEGAASLILESIERFEKLASARDALDIALEIRRLRALGAISARRRSAAGAPIAEENALAEALRTACERFPGDAMVPSWRLERAMTLSAETGNGDLAHDAAASAPPWLVRAFTARAERTAASAAAARGDALEALARLEGALRILDSRERPAALHAHAERREALDAARAWLDLARSRPARAMPPELASLADLAPAVGLHAARLLTELIERGAAELDRPAADASRAETGRGLAAFAALARAGADDPANEGAAETARALASLLIGERSEAERTARAALGRFAADRPLRWILAESLRGAGKTAEEEAFGHFRALAPIAARERDLWWWRGQLGQLEILSVAGGAQDPSRADIVARVNQLAAIDPSLGGEALRARFALLRVGEAP